MLIEARRGLVARRSLALPMCPRESSVGRATLCGAGLESDLVIAAGGSVELKAQLKNTSMNLAFTTRCDITQIPVVLSQANRQSAKNWRELDPSLAFAMRSFVFRWLTTTVAVMVASSLPLGIRYDSVGSLIGAALLLGILNAFVRPVLLILSAPLILISGRGDEARAQELMKEAGVRGFLPKPFAMNRLMEKITEVAPDLEVADGESTFAKTGE